MRSVVILLALAGAAAAQDEVYLTEDQALEAVFKNGETVRKVSVELTEAQKRNIEIALKGRKVDSKWTVFIGLNKDMKKPTGYAVITEEMGKYKPITFIVGVDTVGKITDVSIMVYREPVGSDVKVPWWRKQFQGKTAKDAFTVKRDVMNISGATMSCEGVSKGIKKVVTFVTEVFVKAPGTAEKLLQNQNQNEQEPVRVQKVVMGSICTIAVYHDDEKAARAAIDKAFEEIKTVDRVLSNYDESSELSQINKNGKGKASDRMAEFLTASLKYCEATQGAFDITIGPAVRLWGFFDHKERVPAKEAIEKVKPLVNYRNVDFNPETREVRLKLPGMELDPGAIGKGIAVDKAAETLKKNGITSGIVDFGSSMFVIGTPPGKDAWTIGLKNPFDSTRLCGVMKLKDTGVSTSGHYEKFFEENDQVYSHILDPRTCTSVITMASTTVVAKTATEADALTTAFFVLGIEKALELAKKLGVDAALIPVAKDLKLEMTEGFRKIFVEEK